MEPSKYNTHAPDDKSFNFVDNYFDKDEDDIGWNMYEAYAKFDDPNEFEDF